MWDHMAEGGFMGWFAVIVMLLVIIGAIAIIIVKNRGTGPDDE